MELESHSQLDAIVGERTGTRIDEGSFSLSPEAVRERYQNVLEDPRDGLFFFVQTAHKWKSSQLTIKVLRWAVEISFEIPGEFRELAKSVREKSEKLLTTIYPPEHPLSELAHGYLTLTQGLPRLEHTLEISSDLKELRYRCCEKKFRRFRFVVSSASTLRIYATTKFRRALYPSVPTVFDGKPFDSAKTLRYVKTPELLAIGLNPDKVSADHSLVSGSGELAQTGAKLVVRKPSLTEPLTVFHHEELVFKVHTGVGVLKDFKVLPIQHGVALRPLPINIPFKGQLLIYAEGLKTDFGRRELSRGPELDQVIESRFRDLSEVFRRMKSQEKLYELELGAKEILKQSAVESAAIGLVGLKAVTLSPLISPALAVGTFAVRASRSLNLEKAAEKLAEHRTKWLKEPELIEFLRHHGSEEVN